MTAPTVEARLDALEKRIDALTAHRVAPRLKLADVMDLSGLSEATINRRVKDGTFPAPEAWLGPHRVWNRAAVEAWIAEQAAAPRPARKLVGIAAAKHEQRVARENALRRKGART